MSSMHLLLLSGPDKGRVFLLNEGCPQTIGRSHVHTEITLQDTEVARVHCQVALAGDSLVVTDLDGTSSTFVNDQVINEHTMKPGDLLRIGQSLLCFQKEHVGRPAAQTVVPKVVVKPQLIPVAPALPVDRGSKMEDRGSKETSLHDPQSANLDTKSSILDLRQPTRLAVPSAPAPPGANATRLAVRAPVVPPQRAEGEAAIVPLVADELHELAGTTLGHFELGPVLGHGHTGAVFKARDVKTLRTVALRVLPAEFPKNDAERQRFIQAVKNMLHLDHVHLIKLYGAGKAGDYHWLSSEYVEGQSLGQLMQQGRSSGLHAWEPAYRIAVHIGRALDCAHQHQFIHRNITPTDILVAGKGNHIMTDGVAKLNDLVMFKALEGSGLRQVSLRAKVATDLAYFSPEQTYAGAPVDARSDIFSLGSVVYAVLMGRPPFEGPSQAETVRRIREEPPVSPRKLHPLLPRLFDSILLKMLAKPPEHRFQTAAELLAALDQISHHRE